MSAEYKCIDCGKILDGGEINRMGFQGFTCRNCGGRIILLALS